MIAKEVNIDFGNESRDRGNAFGIKRSKTKRLIKNPHKAMLAKDLKFNRKIIQKESKKHNSEKLKKRLNLIEDYFYPEIAIGGLDPMDITPIIQRNKLGKTERRHYKSKSTIGDIEGTQAYKEFSDNTDGMFLNFSIIEIIRKIIKIDDADIIAFENWDKCIVTDFTENVKNDIKRSRIRDSIDKDSILEDLLMIIIFYGQNNTIVYQQGMQDIFIPFLYLKSKEFSLAEVYAYTKGYIDMFMPNTLHSKYNGKDYSLPHLQCQLSLCKMLLKYHDIELHNHFGSLEIEVEAFATSWILTQFSRVVEFSLIYELIEIILFEKDQLMALYMTISLLKYYKNDILKRNSIEVLLPFVQRKVKITNIRELCQLYYQAVAIRSKTPLSFAILIHKLKINDPATVISNEEMKELQNLELETFIVYPEEVLFHQNKITNGYHLYNASNNDKSMNKFYEIQGQSKNDAGTKEQDILKHDGSNDTEIGKNVSFLIIDLTNKKKTSKTFKDALIGYGVKGSTVLEILQEKLPELHKSNILIVTSDHKVKLDSSELARFEETLTICSYLGVSRVSVLKGGLKNYLRSSQ